MKYRLRKSYPAIARRPELCMDQEDSAFEQAFVIDVVVSSVLFVLCHSVRAAR